MSENKTVVVPVDKELQLAKVEAAAHEATIGHLSQRVDEAVALAEEAVELMTRFHSHAQPDDTPDMNAVFPAMHFRNFVDDHARLMFKLNQFQRNPVEPSFLRLKKAADLVCAVMGAHGEISARDDRVQALMNCLYETDPLKSVYADDALSAAPAATAPQDELAYIAACNLAKAIHAQHYREDSTNWRVLPDLRGVISQIDNMVAGMTRAAPLNAIRLNLEWEDRPAIDASSRLYVFGLEIEVFPNICKTTGNTEGYDAVIRPINGDDWNPIKRGERTRDAAKEAVHTWLVRAVSELIVTTAQPGARNET